MAGIDDYRRKCWDAALHAYGTSHIFQRRARDLKRKTDVLTWVGLVVPLLIGALVGTFGRDEFWGTALAVGAVIAAAQLAIVLWSLVKHWPEDLAYSSASAVANESLAGQFVALAEDPPALPVLRTRFDKLSIEDSARRARDSEKNVKDKELRRGMRAALRKYQRPCLACQQVPMAMTPTACDVCGKF